MIGMSKITSGPFWHIHHDRLLEWSGDIEKRIACIESDKPQEEIGTRLHLMKPVLGRLPEEVVEASKAHYEASKAHYEACKAHLEAACKAHHKTSMTLDEANKARYEACRAHYEASKTCCEASKALDEAIMRNLPAIEALHKQECPNCPWNGTTIFPSVSQ